MLITFTSKAAAEVNMSNKGNMRAEKLTLGAA